MNLGLVGACGLLSGVGETQAEAFSVRGCWEKGTGWRGSCQGAEQAGGKRKEVLRKRKWEDIVVCCSWVACRHLAAKPASAERKHRLLPLLGLQLKHRDYASNWFFYGL